MPIFGPAISYDLCHPASWSPYHLQMCELSWLRFRDATDPHGRLENPSQRDLASAQGTHRGDGVKCCCSHLWASQEYDPCVGKQVSRSPSRALPLCVGACVFSVNDRRR